MRAPDVIGKVRRALALAGSVMVVSAGMGTGEAKSPGTTYCFNAICHRVLTLETTAALIGREVELETSYYDGCKFDVFNPCGLTSSGEVFRPWSPDNAASPVYPDGTTLLVYNPDTRQAAVVRVNNAGPYWGRRRLDVSRATAEKLGFRRRGIARLKVMVIGAPTAREASYRRRRSYDTVPGPIGEFETMAEARRAVAGLMMTSSSRFAGLRMSPIVTGSTSVVEREEKRQPAPTDLVATAMLSLPPVAYAGALRDPLAPYRVEVPAVPATVVAATEAEREREPELTVPSATAATVLVAGVETEVRPGAQPQPEAVRVAAWSSTDFTKPGEIAVNRGQPLRYTLEERPIVRRIEIAVTRRLDTFSPENEPQSVLKTPTLDTAAQLMDHDLSSARISRFSPRLRLQTLEPQPVGRLAAFARAAAGTLAVAQRPEHAAPQPVPQRVSSVVRWARMQLSGATTETTR